jgi:hypothetical protein
VKVVSEAPDRLKMPDIAKLLGVSIDIAKVIVYPLVDKELRSEGAKRGACNFPLGKAMKAGG